MGPNSDVDTLNTATFTLNVVERTEVVFGTSVVLDRVLLHAIIIEMLQMQPNLI